MAEQEGAGQCRALGKGSFVLGYGPDGVFGEVELSAELIPNPGDYWLRWTVGTESASAEARHRIRAFVDSYVASYLETQPSIGLGITLQKVVMDPVRRNDYERAANLALRDALTQLGLPVPRIKGED